MVLFHFLQVAPQLDRHAGNRLARFIVDNTAPTDFAGQELDSELRRDRSVLLAQTPGEALLNVTVFPDVDRDAGTPDAGGRR